jgi:16S rRNA C967 or C1407 C5-methylase (RsmB/RsmF family)
VTKNPPKPKVSNTLRKVARNLFADETEQERFIGSLTDPVTRPTAVVWTDQRPEKNPFTPDAPIVWLPEFVDLVSFEQRPGRHSVHESGDIYCLDPSSVFASRVLSVVDDAELILDLCASPGGKSILAWLQCGRPNLLCNEVIGKRTGTLIANLRRCRIHPTRVCSIDTAPLADQLGAVADVVIVDAPCSGQSLIARGKKSPGCFHPATMNMNANRQRRILSNAVRLVAPGGWLAYMTCTYALKENECNLEWLLKHNPQLEAVEVPLLADFQSSYSAEPCYRLWPFDSVGAGAFAAILRSTDEPGTTYRYQPPGIVWSSERQE